MSPDLELWRITDRLDWVRYRQSVAAEQGLYPERWDTMCREDDRDREFINSRAAQCDKLPRGRGYSGIELGVGKSWQRNRDSVAAKGSVLATRHVDHSVMWL